MHHKRSYIGAVIVLAISLSVSNATAQFGGLTRKVPGLGKSSDAAGEVGSDIKVLADKVTPASKFLDEAADYYARALGIKREAAKANVKQGEIPGIAGTKQTTDSLREYEPKMKEWATPLTAQQKELCGKGHEKLIEGTGSLAAVAAPTALAIKKVTDSNPAALAVHPDLAALGVFCAKDSVKLMSFLKVATEFNKKWDAPVSTKALPDDAFKP